MSWHRCEQGDWPATVELLAASGMAWPRGTAVQDLRWHLQRTLDQHGGRASADVLLARLPSGRLLAERWRWTHWSARKLLIDVDTWWDVAAFGTHPERRTVAAQSPHTPQQSNADNAATSAQSPHTGRNTRVDLTKHHTPDNSPLTPLASEGGRPEGVPVDRPPDPPPDRPPDPAHQVLVGALDRVVDPDRLAALVAGERGALAQLRLALGSRLPVGLLRARSLQRAIAGLAELGLVRPRPPPPSVCPSCRHDVDAEDCEFTAIRGWQCAWCVAGVGRDPPTSTGPPTTGPPPLDLDLAHVDLTHLEPAIA